MPSRRAARASGPSPSPAGNRSPSPAAASSRGGGGSGSSGGAGALPELFKLRLELPSADDPQNPAYHTVCFFRNTSADDLGRAISAAFYEQQQREVVAVWEHPDGSDDGDADAGPLVHLLSGVVAHPELYSGRLFSLTARPREVGGENVSAAGGALELLHPEPDAVTAEEAAAVPAQQPPVSLLDVLTPLAPHPRQNPEMLVALTLAAGALLSHDPSSGSGGSATTGSDDPDGTSSPSEAAASAVATIWRLTISSRIMILVLFAVVLAGQLCAVLRDERAGRALARLQTILSDSRLQQRVGGGAAAVVALWFLRIFDTAARLAIVGVAHCVSGAASVLRLVLELTSVAWCEAQLRQLMLSIQRLFLPLLEMGDYSAKQLYLHGPPSPLLSHSLGFLDLPLDYSAEPTARADACQKLSPLRSTDFWR